MPLQKPLSGTASEKRNSWMRGNGSCSMRGEKKHGISRNKKISKPESPEKEQNRFATCRL